MPASFRERTRPETSNMLEFRLDHLFDKPTELLVIGAHSDDIEIGAGGTIRQLLGSANTLNVQWVVLAAPGERKIEALRSARSILGADPKHRIETHDFRDGFFPYDGARIKETFEQLKKDAKPDVILTHFRDDLHQDHRLTSELTWNTFRDHLILEYEIPKYDGGLGSPNVLVPLTADVVA
ncbi:MAG TPA: PIG-L deacetylase family protein, partial [Terriglobales bacterium]|nr:PIG-L deacetylase family protein [Terriglobales bacterium]